MKEKWKSELRTNGEVTKILTQEDGKILVAGKFDKFRGEKHSKLGRLNPDGNLDTSFKIKDKHLNSRGLISSMALQNDGKILIGGILFCKGFYYLIRLNPDGSVDDAFAPFKSVVSIGINNSGNVKAISIQKDGIIVIGKNWGNSIEWVTAKGEILVKKEFLEVEYKGALTRLVTNSPLDVYSLEIQNDGKIIVGSLFSEHPDIVVKQPKNNVFRLNPDGSLDSTLDLDIEMDVLDGLSLATLSDGALLVSGRFKKINGQRQKSTLGMFYENQMIKFNSDGTIDKSFHPFRGATFTKIVVQPDGKILRQVGIRFSISRTNPDGTDDPTFKFSGTDGYTTDFALQPDGKIIIGGKFKKIDNKWHENIARLNSDGTLDDSFL